MHNCAIHKLNWFYETPVCASASTSETERILTPAWSMQLFILCQTEKIILILKGFEDVGDIKRNMMTQNHISSK